MLSGRNRCHLTMVVSAVASMGLAANTKADDPPAAGVAQTAAPSIADAFAKLKAEYDAALQHAEEESEKGSDEGEQWKIYKRLMPDFAAYCRRAVDLAQTDVTKPEARDALLWVCDAPGQSGTGPYGDEFGRAAGLLLRYHGDDPEVGRLGLQLDNVPTRQRDALLQGLLLTAEKRETRGLARLSLAQYLETRAKVIAYTRFLPDQKTMRVEARGDDGQSAWQEYKIPIEQRAYWQELRLLDVEAVRNEARRLFEEVIAEYGDVPCVTRHQQRLARLLEEPEPKWNGKPLTAEEINQLRTRVDRKRTLAEVAQARLDEMLNLNEGQPAPEFEGTDLNGQPLQLASYRGKVVMLVFWGSWCGPCMAEVPHEKELAERYQGRPFAVLGVDCRESREAGRKTADEKGMTWPSCHDGEDDDGPIATLYHVRGYPSVFVIDAQGVIRSRDSRGEAIDALIESLVKEAEGPGERGASAP